MNTILRRIAQAAVPLALIGSSAFAAPLPTPQQFGLVAGPGLHCQDIGFDRFCGTVEQFAAFAKETCHRFRDGFGGDAKQCFDASMAFSNARTGFDQ
jgi:hypothetical protein